MTGSKPDRDATETSSASGLRLGLVQSRCTPDPEENLHRALEGVREAAAGGAHVVCLQELFQFPYFCQHEDPAFFDWAEPIPGPASQRLSALARQLGVVLVAPLFERRAPGLYHNTALILDAGGRSPGLYRKMHIPDDPGYYEKFYFTPGDLGFQAHATRHGSIGVLICWDQWFPEAARATALGGAQILLYPSAIGWFRDDSPRERREQQDAWETVQRSHAIANGVFVAAVNRVGEEGAIQFWGRSFVCDPWGRVLARASDDGDQVLVVECRLPAVEATRRIWPFLRDRRIESYDGLLARWGSKPDFPDL